MSRCKNTQRLRRRQRIVAEMRAAREVEDRLCAASVHSNSRFLSDDVLQVMALMAKRLKRLKMVPLL